MDWVLTLPMHQEDMAISWRMAPPGGVSWNTLEFGIGGRLEEDRFGVMLGPWGSYTIDGDVTGSLRGDCGIALSIMANVGVNLSLEYLHGFESFMDPAWKYRGVRFFAGVPL